MSAFDPLQTLGTHSATASDCHPRSSAFVVRLGTESGIEALIDNQPFASIFRIMIRFILSCLVALSFLGSAPAIAAMASPPPVQSNECTMTGDTQDQPADHGKMACCTSDCTMAGTVGLAERSGVELSLTDPVEAPLFLATVKQLDSLDWATVDPPPRRLPS
jgi:hypothetical protein